jgi:hypothetical protein
MCHKSKSGKFLPILAEECPKMCNGKEIGKIECLYRQPAGGVSVTDGQLCFHHGYHPLPAIFWDSCWMNLVALGIDLK